MKIILIGLGSMGKRRIRILNKRADVEQIIGVDSNSERRNEATQLYGIETAESIQKAVEMDAFDCAFVCTSPLSHNSIIRECLQHELHVFTEINLVSDGYEANIELSNMVGKYLFLSSTFLYREETQYIAKKVKAQNTPVNYIYHIGQYLPDWHPWESYKNFFVGSKRTNGCREIMAIEMPWLTEAFGEIKSVAVLHGTMSSLDLGYDDNYMIQITHRNGNKGSLIIDVVCRKAVRNFEAYSEDLYLSWDGTPQGLEEYDIEAKSLNQIQLYRSIEHTEGYQATVIENAYENEIDEFFAVIRGDKDQTYGFKKDLTTLKWLDRIEGIQ